MQQAPIMLPPGFTGNERIIMLVPAPKQRRPPPQWNQCCAKALGITFIIIAVVAVACNIGWFSIRNSLAPVSVGFWAGPFVLVTGVLLTVSGFRPSRCLIISVLVMSILTNVFESVAFITVGAVQLALAPYGLDTEYSPPSPIPDSVVNGSVGFGALFLSLGILCFILLLTVSIMSCASLCCNRNTQPNVAYIPQEVVFNRGGLDTCHIATLQNLSHYSPTKLEPPAMSFVDNPNAAFSEPPPAYY